MGRRSPTLEGFQLLFRRPSFGLAEIAWRWTFGGAAATLAFLSLLEYFDTLPVTNADRFLLRTRHPALVSRALNDIFHNSGQRFVAASLVLGLTLAVAWIATASWGRAVTLQSLAAYFRHAESGASYRLRSLAGLNFFRVVITVAAAVGWIGALVLGGIASPDKNPSPGIAVLVFFAVIVLVGLAWAVLNWFLSLAAVFVVIEGRDTFGAIGSAASLVRNRFGAVLAASIWFGLAHGGAFVIATTLVGFPLAFAGLLPAGVVLGGVLLVTLLYFAVADLLYLGRLGAYVWIAEAPDPPSMPEPPPLPPAPAETIDRSELILSDHQTVPATC